MEQVLRCLVAMDTRPKGRNLPLSTLNENFPKRPLLHTRVHRPASAGLTPLNDILFVLGLRPWLGQWSTEAIMRFVQKTIDFGLLPAHPLRLAPGRLLLLPNISANQAAKLIENAQSFELSAEKQDPTAAIIACAGRPACISAHYATRSLAQRLLVEAKPLLDGSLIIHLSGCRKGCAHHEAALSLVGYPGRFELLFSGQPGDAADQVIAGEEGEFTIEKLAQLVAATQQPDENAVSCLTRLRDVGIIGTP